MFSRILMIAVLAGVCTALPSTALQMAWAMPLIDAAEVYEAAAEPPHVLQAHQHSGVQRAGLTLASNLSFAVGVSLVLSGLFLLRGSADARVGLYWGVVGFLAFSLAPSLGLPPELPGTAAAALEERQVWWLLVASATLAAIVMAVVLRSWWTSGAALCVAALPHLLDAPQPEAPAALAPLALQHEFVAASLCTMLAFWVIAGATTGALFRRAAPARTVASAPLAR